MNDLLFSAITIALLYHFFYYLPNQEKLDASPPLNISKAVQTDPDLEKEKELTPILDELIKEIRKLNQTIK